ncbi:PREDICTED: leucine-rich repeat-containing protein 15-like [Priapulus caudatus]|uniref:Leucine-rich repeat-containing protein 15-like n=1 Tax=Priapulus caudatus TaxID=37621 RepID=A0ABM1DN68_PRICU|nr:PREDICTED: leucine-rich repeat-containing protein 15-like [Priapulus caudatus]
MSPAILLRHVAAFVCVLSLLRLSSVADDPDSTEPTPPPTTTDLRCPAVCRCVRRSASMYCSSRALESLPDFTDLDERVKSVYVSDNRLTNLTAASLAGLRNVERLYLRKNTIHTISPGAFSELSELRELHVADNRISCAAASCDGAFDGLDKLAKLEFGNNDVSMVTAAMLAPLRAVVTLVLRDNRIETIEPDAFRQLPQLTNLFLSGNELHLSSGIFTGLENLRELDLENNSIFHLHENEFSGLDNLTKLTLSYNPLKILHDEILRRVPNLRTLNIAGLQLTAIDADLFEGLDKLESLFINDNLFKEPESFMRAISGKLPSLMTLDVSHNPLRELPADFVTDLPALKTLWINRMPKLERVRAHALRGLPSLQTLQLRYNRLLTVIEENAISFDDDAPVVLDTVVMSNNDLKELPESLLPWDRMKTLDLQGNPWQCDCTSLWMPGLKTNINWRFQTNFICASPENLKGQKIIGLNSTLLQCDVSDGVNLSTGVIAAMIVVAAAICASAFAACFLLGAKKPCMSKREQVRRQSKYVSMLSSGMQDDEGLVTVVGRDELIT